MSQRMRHYPFSHRISPKNVAWSSDVPSSAIGSLTTHFEFVEYVNTQWGSPFDHLWQAVFAGAPLLPGGTRGTYEVRNTNDFRIRGTMAIDETWWPKTTGIDTGWYHQLGAGSSSANPAFLNLTYGCSMPYPQEVPHPRQDYRNVINKYWPNCAMIASGSLQFKRDNIYGTSVDVANFQINRKFGYEVDPIWPQYPWSPIRTRPASVDFEETPVLPTIWHPGVEGESIYTHTYESLSNLITYDNFTVSYQISETEHQAAIDEYYDLYTQLKAIVTGFTGTFVTRAAGVPYNKNMATFNTQQY